MPNQFELLSYLEKSCHATGLKVEFGEEGSRIETVRDMSKLAYQAGLDFTVKISGCEAVGDLYDLSDIKVRSIVVPMVESPYAVQKFVDSVKKVFSSERLNNMKLYINIETQYGYKFLDEIMNSPYLQYISGIVFGRTDFVKSLGIENDKVNSRIILDYAVSVSEIAKAYGKEFIIGGGVSFESLDFFRNIPHLTNVETRNVIFDAHNLLCSSNAFICIEKAVEFEISRIKNKILKTQEDLKRLQILEKRLKSVSPTF